MPTKEKTPTDLLIQIAKILNELGIAYYVTGGFAVSVWGKPRFTADIDLIISMTRFQKNDFAQKIKAIFPNGYLDKNQIDTALSRQGEFNFVEPNSGMKIDFWIAKKDEFEKQCFKNKKSRDIGYKVDFISPEDLIISKLIWFKESGSNRHLEDVQTVLSIANPDKKYLKGWTQKLGLQKELALLRR